MERTILIAKSYDQGLFYSKKFKNEAEAISYGEKTRRRSDIITYIKEKHSNHRWDVDIIDLNNETNKLSLIIVNSRKNARLIAKILKEYDDTLKIKINKIY